MSWMSRIEVRRRVLRQIYPTVDPDGQPRFEKALTKMNGSSYSMKSANTYRVHLAELFLGRKGVTWLPQLSFSE